MCQVGVQHRSCQDKRPQSLMNAWWSDWHSLLISVSSTECSSTGRNHCVAMRSVHNVFLSGDMQTHAPGCLRSTEISLCQHIDEQAFNRRGPAPQQWAEAGGWSGTCGAHLSLPAVRSSACRGVHWGRKWWVPLLPGLQSLWLGTRPQSLHHCKVASQSTVGWLCGTRPEKAGAQRGDSVQNECSPITEEG